MVSQGWILRTEYLTLSEFTEGNADNSRTTETPTEEMVTITADKQVATYLIFDQMTDLIDAIREAVQNGIDRIEYPIRGFDVSLLKLVHDPINVPHVLFSVDSRGQL